MRVTHYSRNFTLTALISFITWVIPTNLIADDTTIPTITPEPPPEKNAEIITVTAQKREESIQQVPISITAIDNSELSALGITDPQDIAYFSPGLYARPTIAHNNPLFSVRGIGFNDFTSIQNPAVAVYLDQVIVPYHTMMGFQLFDMERVEVLKGPQGTLYGRNSTAGAINFITHKPTFEDETYGTFGYSSYDTYEFEAMLNAPVNDQFAVRFALKTLRRLGSYQDNRLDDDHHYGEQDQFDSRLSLLWTPSDEVDLLVNLHGGYDKSGLVAPEHLATLDANDLTIEPCAPVAAGDRAEGACTNAGGYFDPDDNPYDGDYSVQNDRLDNRSSGASITLHWYLPRATFTSITGYDSFERYQPQDADASPFAFIDMLFVDETWVFSQELRLSSAKNDAFGWMLGLYYSEDDVNAHQSADVSDLIPGGTATAVNDQKSDSTAAFVNLDYWLNSHWKLFGGIRFTDEHKKWKGGSTLAGGENLSSNSISNQDLSGNIGLDYQLNDNDLWYISATNSYRSGGFPGGFTMVPKNLTPFDKEEVYAYETGIKTLSMDQQLIVNAAMYYYDWRDFQSVITEVAGGLVSLHLSNVGDATIYGAELDMSWRANSQWELSGGLNWMKTKITNTDTPELESNHVSNAPELMFNTLIRYHFDLFQLPITAQADAHYTDEYFFATDNAAVFKAKELWLVNARLTLRIPQPYKPDSSTPIELSLWGENLGDKDYRVGGFNQFAFSGDSFFYYGEPRTIGLSIKFTY